MEKQEDGGWARKLGKLDRYSADEIITAWQRHTKRTRPELYEISRTKPLSTERLYLYVLLYRDTRHSTTKIGNLIGGRDHSVVVRGIERVWSFLEAKDPAALKFLASVEAFYPPPSRKPGIQEALAKKSLEEPHTMVA